MADAIDGQEKVKAALAAAGDFKKIDAPLLYTSGMYIMRTGSDFICVLQKPHPATLANGQIAPFAVLEPVAVVVMSAGTMKDLHHVLGEHLRVFEEAVGDIETDFTRQQQEREASRQ